MSTLTSILLWVIKFPDVNALDLQDDPHLFFSFLFFSSTSFIFYHPVYVYLRITERTIEHSYEKLLALFHCPNPVPTYKYTYIYIKREKGRSGERGREKNVVPTVTAGLSGSLFSVEILSVGSDSPVD